MTAPIDRIENVRAQVADVERQMEACRAAGVQFSPSMTWRLLSACKSLLGPTLAARDRAVKAEALREAADALDKVDNECDAAFWDGGGYELVTHWLESRADQIARDGATQ